ADGDAEVGDGVLHRVGDGGGAGDGAAFAHALDAEGIDGRAVLGERHGNGRQVVGAGNGVVHEAAGEELAALAVDDGLHEPGADGLHGAALQLCLDDHRIDGTAGVVDHGIAEQAYGGGLEIH